DCEDRSGMWQGLQESAALGVPESDERIIPAAGQRSSIRGKGQAEDAGGLPHAPERSSTLHLPQRDRAIPAPAGESAFVRAEGEGIGRVGMRLPDQMQGLTSLAPHTHFPTPAPGCPVLPVAADSYRPGGVKGLGKDGIT